MSTPSDEYKLRRLTQLQSAIERCDGDATVLVVQVVRSDGYEEWAREVLDHLTEAGLDRAAGVSR